MPRAPGDQYPRFTDHGSGSWIVDLGPELDRALPAFLCRPDQDHGPRIMDQDPSLNIMDHGSGFIFVPGDKRVRFLSYPGINKGLNMGSSSQGLKSHLIYLFCCSCKKIHAAAEDCLEPFVLNKSPFQQRFFSGSSSQRIMYYRFQANT